MQIRSIRSLAFKVFSALFPALLLALVVLSVPTASFAQIGLAITIGPPPLPVYEQPICPGDGYMWVPGYWAYDYDISDYYWVPGTWVLAPEVGFLWTPGYWGWGGDRFVFYEGYWGPHVGFYGGINYGFGYFGLGFEGGRWDGGHFFYNRAVLNVNVTEIHNVYNTTVIENRNHISFNGGNGGIEVRPRPEEEAAMHERHVGPISAQTQHVQAARGNPQMRASVNMGRPSIAATARPGEFSGRGVVAAREAGGAYTPAARGGTVGHAGNVVHPHDLPPVERPSAPNTGNPKLDQKYQQQQEKMLAKQNQEREKLQQQQEKEHQQLARQNASEEKKQQVEQRHQQQTQQLQQKHQQQTQQFQQKVQQRPGPKR
ncbi:MAG: YXWGXW repeat-containing protein [Terriglobales bacterium]